MAISANPPHILIPGSSVILTCMATLDSHVDAFGSVLISWGGPRIISGPNYLITQSGFGLVYSSNLTISEVENNNDGEYTCTARVPGDRNVFGSTITESISVSVLGKDYSLIHLNVI